MKEIETITMIIIRKKETPKMTFFLKPPFILSISKRKNMATEMIKPKTGLLEPIEGKINRAKINMNRKKSFKYLDEKKNMPKRIGKKADKQAPKELGSLKVELI